MNQEALKENRAEDGHVESCAGASAAEAKVPQLEADILLLIDIVTESSRRVELIERPALLEAFRLRAATAPLPEARELLEDAEAQMDRTYNRAPGTVSFVPKKTKDKEEREANRLKVPTLRDQREAFSRRELIRSLLEGKLAQPAQAAQPASAEAPCCSDDDEHVEQREITEEYFDSTVKEALSRDCGLASLESWDGKTYFHYRPLLSASYARILSAKNNPAEMICDLVRESSRIYPRPVTLGTFQEDPFNLSPEELQALLQAFPKDPSKSDIKFTQSSLGTVFLYSNKYLEDDYADFLAQYLDVDQVMSP